MSIKRFLQLRFFLLVATGLIALYFIVQVLSTGYQYVRLDERTRAQDVVWEVQMRSVSHYVLAAHYTYHVDGQEFRGMTRFTTPFYFNYHAAEREIRARQAEKFSVWYQKKHPSFSSLQKKFPKKECIYALLTCGVFVYFYLARSLLKSFADTFKGVT